MYISINGLHLGCKQAIANFFYLAMFLFLYLIIHDIYTYIHLKIALTHIFYLGGKAPNPTGTVGCWAAR